MSLTSEFVPLELDQLRREAAVLKADGWRFIQTHAVNADEGIDLYYSFMKDGHIVNYRVEGVTKETPVPSITDLFLAAFVFENEARELFGVDMRDIALDFQGAMYAPAENEPMTFITPQQKAAREKARQAALKASAGDKGEAASDAPAAKSAPSGGFKMTPELQARLDAKLPTLTPEKRAKVEAALKARAAEAATREKSATPVSEPAKTEAAPAATAKPAEQASAAPAPAAMRDTVLEQKIAALDAEKAAKVRAALSGKDIAVAAQTAVKEAAAETLPLNDPKLEELLKAMDGDKAARVRSAINAKGGE